MLISVITATYNSEKTISRNINSVIRQNYNNFEHIIVDNLSSDDTIQIAQKIYLENNIASKLRIISEKDEGIADAFNKGIKASNGQIISIINSDDFYYDEYVFNRVLKQFENPEIQFVHGDIYFFDEKYGSNIRRPLPAVMMKGMLYNHPTLFVRKSFYEKTGLFNTNYKYSMDFEFYCRIARNYEPDKISVYISDQPLVQMSSGGASWKYEFESIKENKKAMIEYGFWNREGRKFYLARLFRTKLKKIFNYLGLDFAVKIWRDQKWRNKIDSFLI